MEEKINKLYVCVYYINNISDFQCDIANHLYWQYMYKIYIPWRIFLLLKIKR